MKILATGNFSRNSRNLASLLLVVAFGFFANLALGGGEEFYVSGVVVSTVNSDSRATGNEDIVGVYIVEDGTGRIRKVGFSRADEQRFPIISSIRNRDRVTIDGAIMGTEQHIFSIIVNGHE
jgi:hypothetical protein